MPRPTTTRRSASAIEGLLPPLLGGNRDLNAGLNVFCKRCLGDRAGTTVVKIGRLKDAGAHRRHLGSVIGADDGGHQVTINAGRVCCSRPVSVSIEHGTVGRKARLQAHGNAGRQFAAKGGRTVQNNSGLRSATKSQIRRA